MKKVAIIGLGHVGSTVAYTLINRALCDALLLLDRNPQLAEDEKNDLMDGQIGNRSHVQISSNDETKLADCNLVIFATGNQARLQNDTDPMDQLSDAKASVEEWAPKLKEDFQGVVLCITSPNDVITQYMQALTGFSKNRVIGVGTMLNTARALKAVAKYLNVDANCVSGYVLGEHEDAHFVAWSTIRVGSQLAWPAVSVGSQRIMSRLNDSQMSAYGYICGKNTWRSNQGKGYVCYGIADQTANCARAILQDARTVLPVSNYDKLSGCYIGHPAVVGKDGVVTDLQLDLNEREQGHWDDAVDRIKELYLSLGTAVI